MNVDALVQLLAMPDEPCMPPRTHRYTYDRDPHRDAQVIKRDLGRAYVAHRCHDYGPDVSCVVSVKKHNVFKIVRRA